LIELIINSIGLAVKAVKTVKAVIEIW